MGTYDMSWRGTTRKVFLSVITVSYLKTNRHFSSLSVSQEEVPLKQTTTVSHIFSTTSFTLFEVIVSIIVLQISQVLCQTCAGMSHRAEVKKMSVVSNNFDCVDGLVMCVLFFCGVEWFPDQWWSSYLFGKYEASSLPRFCSLFRCAHHHTHH